MHRHAGHFADLLFRERVERSAGNGQVIALDNGKFVDLHLQLFARATNQNPLLLQRADQLQDTADIIDGSATDLLGTLHHDLRPDTITREQFLQQGSVFLIANQVATPHTATAGFYCATQKTHGAGVIIPLGFQRFHAGLGFVREKLRHNHPFIVYDALRGAKPNHFFRLQFDGQLGGDLFRRQVKTFTRHGDRHGPHQHDGTAVQLAMNGVFIDAANATAVAIIHTVVHAKRLSDDEVAAHHVDMRALQRRIVQAHREARSDIQLQQPRSLLNQFQRFGIGYAGVLVVNRLMVVCRQVGVNLRTCAIHHNQPDTEAVQQANIIDDAGKVFMLNGFAAKHDDKRFSPMGVDIGNRMAESLDQFGSTFLHHGTTLNECLFVIYVFLFDCGRARKPKFSATHRNE